MAVRGENQDARSINSNPEPSSTDAPNAHGRCAERSIRAEVAALGDEELLGRTRALAQRSQRMLALLLAHLAEIDERRLYARFATSSLFDYCVRELGFSEPQAFLRIRAARAARRHPALLALVASGEIHLSGLKLIAPLLDSDDATALIELCRRKTCREIEKLLAERRPKPSAAEQIRRLPQRHGALFQQAVLPPAPAEPRPSRTRPLGEPRRSPALAGSCETGTHDRLPSEKAARPQRPKPLGAGRFKIAFTADGELVGCIEELQALYSHRAPRAELASIIGDALRLLRDALLRKRFGLGARPRRKPLARHRPTSQRQTPPVDGSPTGDRTGAEPTPAHATSEHGARVRADAPLDQPDRATPVKPAPAVRVVSRHIPMSVRRQVFLRDRGQCSYVDQNGVRCGTRHLLELHHCDPWSRGGPHSAENVTLRCRAHNAEAARLAFNGLDVPSTDKVTPRVRVDPHQ